MNFAQGDYLTFGAFMAVLANLSWGVNIVIAALFAMVMTAVLVGRDSSSRSGGRCGAAARRR